ncbi:MAG: hypothetical protein HY050_05605 [Actinobacteria bacterium]|nr:hypothetical protein [Actinomycetota bacterium]
MREIACSDCVVSTLLGGAENGISEVSEQTAGAIELLSSRGILRPLRFLAAGQS